MKRADKCPGASTTFDAGQGVQSASALWALMNGMAIFMIQIR